MQQLNIQLQKRIKRTELAENSLGNVDAHNPHFMGRTVEMRRLREQFVKPDTIGLLTAVHGLGGVGKTALAIESQRAHSQLIAAGLASIKIKNTKLGSNIPRNLLRGSSIHSYFCG